MNSIASVRDTHLHKPRIDWKISDNILPSVAPSSTSDGKDKVLGILWEEVMLCWNYK